MAIVDVCTYNGEKDLWDLHYNVLKEHVSSFIVVEFDKTFTGKDKPWFSDELDYKRYPKAIFFQYREHHYEQYRDLALSSPNTNYGVGASHWVREFMQKESLKDALVGLNDDDIVFIGDVDEIWERSNKYLYIYKGGMKLPLRVYAYWLNNRSDEKFWGTFIGNYGRDIKDRNLNHLRSYGYKFHPDFEGNDTNYCGWHFTSIGGIESVRRKLNDQYTEESYNTPEVQANLEKRLQSGQDYLGRPFTFKVDEAMWPRYLKEHREDYRHLLRPGTE